MADPAQWGTALLALLCLRAAAIGSVRSLIDVTVLSTYVGMYAFGRFIYMLAYFGQNLDPEAPLNLPPFTPVIFGTKKIANFTTHSYPQLGGLFFFGFMLLLWIITVECLVRGRRAAGVSRATHATDG